MAGRRLGCLVGLALGFLDEFAGALLMPEDEVHRLHDEGFSPVRMMLHFGVSAPAVRKRLERLGL